MSRVLSLAGFQVTLIGRFWVTTEVDGRETEIGQPKLDLDKLRQNRVILTNYETIVNYQHSFAKMKEHLSIVVTDEAQEYKTPSTKISHALMCWLSLKWRSSALR